MADPAAAHISLSKQITWDQMFYLGIFHPIHMYGSRNDGAPHTALLEAIMTVKIEIFWS